MDHLTFYESLKWFAIITAAGISADLVVLLIGNWVKRQIWK